MPESNGSRHGAPVQSRRAMLDRAVNAGVQLPPLGVTASAQAGAKPPATVKPSASLLAAAKPKPFTPAVLISQLADYTQILLQANAAYIELCRQLNHKSERDLVFRWNINQDISAPLTVMTPLSAFADDDENRKLILTAFANLHFDQFVAAVNEAGKLISDLQTYLTAVDANGETHEVGDAAADIAQPGEYASIEATEIEAV